MAGLLPTTKAGPGDKEPAFIVLKRHLWKVVALVVLVTLLVLIKIYDYTIDISQLQHATRNLAHNLHFVETAEVSSFAKVGEEFEQHLDRDIRESELSQGVLHRIKDAHKEHTNNVSRAIDEAMAMARGSVNEFTASGMDSEAMASFSAKVLDRLEEDLRMRVVESTNFAFVSVEQEVGALVKKLSMDARRAQDRRDELQDEIADKLRWTQQHQHADGVDPNQGWIEDIDGDGKPEDEYAPISDDEWAQQAEVWHNETVTTFFNNLQHYQTDPNSTLVRNKLDESSKLYEEFNTALQHLYDDKVPWHDVQDLIHERVGDIKKSGLPEYIDAEPPQDDEYTGFQSWHVQAYLEDCLWPTRLRNALPKINSLKRTWLDKSKTSLDVVGELEDMAADGIIPHHWLHHGIDDDMYRGGDFPFYD